MAGDTVNNTRLRGIRMNDSNDTIIRKFHKRVQAEGILNEMKKRERYRKPSELRKEARIALRRRLYRRRTLP